MPVLAQSTTPRLPMQELQTQTPANPATCPLKVHALLRLRSTSPQAPCSQKEQPPARSSFLSTTPADSPSTTAGSNAPASLPSPAASPTPSLAPRLEPSTNSRDSGKPAATPHRTSQIPQ